MENKEEEKRRKKDWKTKEKTQTGIGKQRRRKKQDWKTKKTITKKTYTWRTDGG